MLSWILKQAGLLRVPREVELAGLDYHTQAIVMEEDKEIISVTIEAGRAPAAAQ